VAKRKHVGVAALPNQCGTCGRFKSWSELVTHFVPDSDYSSEDDSWRECLGCIGERKSALATASRLPTCKDDSYWDNTDPCAGHHR